MPLTPTTRTQVRYDGKSFMYFASTGRPPNGDEPRKMIPVKDTEIKRNPAKLENKLKQKYTFVVEHEDYQMLFSCKNSKERDLWLSALQDGAAGTEAEHEYVRCGRVLVPAAGSPRSPAVGEYSSRTNVRRLQAFKLTQQTILDRRRAHVRDRVTRRNGRVRARSFQELRAGVR